MADKVVKFASKTRKDLWQAFKTGISIKGYHYYQAPEGVKYRYPAPGSCSLDKMDHPNLYKNDWKEPFRTSDYNTQKIEMQYDDEDERQAENYISGRPHLDASHKREGKYDQTILNEHEPNVRGEVLYEDQDITSDDFRKELWKEFDDRQNQMDLLRKDFAPGQHYYYDDYNQINQMFTPRTVGGMDNNPRIKEMFVELEHMIEESIGKPRTVKMQVDAYKGTTKKWQVLDDDCFDRD